MVKDGGWEIMKYVSCMSVCACMCHILDKPLYLIYCEDLFSKFAENVYGYEKIVWKHKLAIIADCWKSLRYSKT